jgi:hypothetical protein
MTDFKLDQMYLSCPGLLREAFPDAVWTEVFSVVGCASGTTMVIARLVNSAGQFRSTEIDRFYDTMLRGLTSKTGLVSEYVRSA